MVSIKEKFDMLRLVCVWLGFFFISDSSLGCSANSQAIEETSGLYDVTLTKEIQTDVNTVWKTLTDYSRLSTFVKGMTRSTVLEGHGSKKVVQQTGILRLLFFSKEFTVWLNVDEKYPRFITMTQFKGDFDHFSGRYDINQTGNNKVRLTWRGTLKPSFYIPPIIGKRIIKKNINKQFCDVISEIIVRNGSKPKIK